MRRRIQEFGKSSRGYRVTSVRRAILYRGLRQSPQQAPVAEPQLRGKVSLKMKVY